MEEKKKTPDPPPPPWNSSTLKDSNDFSTTRLRAVGTTNKGNTFTWVREELSPSAGSHYCPTASEILFLPSHLKLPQMETWGFRCIVCFWFWLTRLSFQGLNVSPWRRLLLLAFNVVNITQYLTLFCNTYEFIAYYKLIHRYTQKAKFNVIIHCSALILRSALRVCYLNSFLLLANLIPVYSTMNTVITTAYYISLRYLMNIFLKFLMCLLPVVTSDFPYWSLHDFLSLLCSNIIRFRFTMTLPTKALWLFMIVRIMNELTDFMIVTYISLFKFKYRNTNEVL